MLEILGFKESAGGKALYTSLYYDSEGKPWTIEDVISIDPSYGTPMMVRVLLNDEFPVVVCYSPSGIEWSFCVDQDLEGIEIWLRENYGDLGMDLLVSLLDKVWFDGLQIYFKVS